MSKVTGIGRWAVRTLVMAIAVIAIPFAPAHADTEAVVFVVDASGSMAGEKIAAAKSAVTDLAGVIPENVAIGLVTFGTRPRLAVTPTVSRKDLISGLKAIAPGGNTALYDGVLLGRTAASIATRGFVVVVTDGEDTASIKSAEIVRNQDWSTTQLSVVGVDFASFETVRKEFQAVVSSSGGVLTSVEKSSLLADALRAALEQSGIVPAEVIPSPTPVQPLLDQPFQFTRDPLHLVLAVLSAFIVSLTVALVVISLVQRQRARARESVIGTFAKTQRKTEVVEPVKVSPLVLGRKQWLPKALEGAGLEMSAISFRYRQLAFLVLVYLLMIFFGFPSSLSLLVAVGLSLWLPGRFLKRLADRRRDVFRSELPDFLSITASALRAGLPISQAIEAAARESTGELGRQMSRALQEMALGSTLDAALREIADRMQSEDFAWLVNAIEIQRRIGGNLSEILDVAAATVRARLELQQEVKTLAAEGILSAKVLTALPIGLFLFLLVSRRDFVAPLWETGVGWILLISVVLLIVLGYQWIKRLSKLEL